MSKVKEMGVTSVSESDSYILRQMVVDLDATLRQVQPMTPKWRPTLQVQRYVFLMSPSPKCQSISFIHCIRVKGHFEKNT